MQKSSYLSKCPLMIWINNKLQKRKWRRLIFLCTKYLERNPASWVHACMGEILRPTSEQTNGQLGRTDVKSGEVDYLEQLELKNLIAALFVFLLKFEFWIVVRKLTYLWLIVSQNFNWRYNPIFCPAESSGSKLWGKSANYIYNRCILKISL